MLSWARLGWTKDKKNILSQEIRLSGQEMILEVSKQEVQIQKK